MFSSQDPLGSTLYISAIRISFTRNIDSIKLRKNDRSLREVERPMTAGEVHKEEFSPPLVLNPNDHAFISIRWSSGFSWSSGLSKQVEVDMSLNQRDVECVCDERGVRSYRKRAKNIQVEATGYHTSSATTPPIIQSCSQIRILVIGNCGVGKSSLIQRVFGVESIQNSDTMRGVADIDREFISPTNEQFVVHDSLGFEASDVANVEIVKQFIAQRSAMPNPQEQIHAIWLCLEIPFANGRLFEAGVERFLQGGDEIWGKIPLIVVLTKLDLLDTQIELDLPEGENPEPHKSAYMNKRCIEPLREAAGKDVTYVTVAACERYSESQANLIKTTNEKLAKYFVDEAPRVVASDARRLQGSNYQLDGVPKVPAVAVPGFQAM